MSLELFLNLGIVSFDVETVFLPGAQEDPGRVFTRIKSLEVTRNDLADARCQAQEIVTFDRQVLIGQGVQFLGGLSAAVQPTAEPGRTASPIAKRFKQIVE